MINKIWNQIGHKLSEIPSNPLYRYADEKGHIKGSNLELFLTERFSVFLGQRESGVLTAAVGQAFRNLQLEAKAFGFRFVTKSGDQADSMIFRLHQEPILSTVTDSQMKTQVSVLKRIDVLLMTLSGTILEEYHVQ